MDRDEVWRAIDTERTRLADLFDSLSDEEWEKPSLCTDWRVREVAAHLTLAHTGLGTALAEIVRARGSFNRMVRDTAIRQARLPTDAYAPMIRAMVGSRAKAPFISDLEPLLDTLVHALDITVPLGRDWPLPPEAAMAAAGRVWKFEPLFHARRRLTGVRLAASDCDWAAGEGEPAEGPMGAILLVLTGRPAGLDFLRGPGLSVLRTRAGQAA